MPKKGFTLTELLISVMLFLIVWLALVGNVIIGKAGEIRSRHYVQATCFAQNTLENLYMSPSRFTNLSNLKKTNPNSSAVVIGSENVATQFNATQQINVDWIVNAWLPGPKKPLYAIVTIRIKWNELLTGHPGNRIVETCLVGYIPNDTMFN